MPSHQMDVSVIIPVKNGMPYIQQCLESLLKQTFERTWEICVYNDGSTDQTIECITQFKPLFCYRGVDLRLCSDSKSRGVGYAKNRAVEMSSGQFICFCDADDVSAPTRLQEQYLEAIKYCESSLVFIGQSAIKSRHRDFRIFPGSMFQRDPENSTKRYTNWANKLTNDELTLQIYTSHGPTLIAPTWFVSRELFNSLDGFKENAGAGFPEDLDFFYRALDFSHVHFSKVEKTLVIYRYHPGCTSFGVSEDAIWNMRFYRLCNCVLPKWEVFTIWNAGKQGKYFFKCLSEMDKKRVLAFCDVDQKKIKREWFEQYDSSNRLVTWKVPIIHVRIARPPLVICVKLDMTGGDLERIISESKWKEGRDFVHFS